MKNSNQLKSCEKSERTISEKQKVAGEEFILARFLHDRFCKFEIPYKAPETIKIIRDISKYIPLIELKEADLSFKLNSLRWFLTKEGREFLIKARKRYLLDQKLKNLDLNSPVAQIKQIDFSVPIGDTIPVVAKTDDIREYKQEIKSIAGFLHN